METGPCAGSCAYGILQIIKFGGKLEFCALLEKPTAHDVVLSLNQSKQWPKVFATDILVLIDLVRRPTSRILLTRTVWSNVSSNRGTLLNGYLP